VRLRSFVAGIVSSNPAGGRGCMCVKSAVCRHIEISASDPSLVQGRPTKCHVSECDLGRYLGLMIHDKKMK